MDTQDKCKDFVVSLFPNERTLVLAELQKLQELHQKKGEFARLQMILLFGFSEQSFSKFN